MLSAWGSVAITAGLLHVRLRVLSVVGQVTTVLRVSSVVLGRLGGLDVVGPTHNVAKWMV